MQQALFPVRFASTVLFSLAAAIALFACGGDYSSGGGGGGYGSASVDGVAASGGPLYPATISLKDSAGKTSSASTDIYGVYHVDVTGLTPPFLLQAAGNGKMLFGVATQAGTANATPYTDIIVQLYYKAQGSTAGAVFGAAGAPSSLPSQAQLNNLEGALRGLITSFLMTQGVHPDQFNLISSSFNADGSGFDRVLDETALNGQNFTVTQGTVQSSVTSSADATGHTASFSQTTTNSANGGSTSQNSSTVIVVPASQQSDYDAAIAGVQITFKNLITVAEQKGANLSTADVMPFIDTAFLNQGENAQAFAQKLVGFFTQETVGDTVTLDSIKSVVSFVDTTNAQQIGMILRLKLAPANGTAFFMDVPGDGESLIFRNHNGSYLFFGDQHIAKPNITVEQTRSYNQNGSLQQDAKRMMAQVNTVLNLLNGVKVDSANSLLPDCTTNPSDFSTARALNQSSVADVRDTGTFNGGDRFDLPCAFGFPAIVGYPPAGTVYQFTLTPKNGGNSDIVQRTVASNTTEAADIATINNQSRTTFASGRTVSTIVGTTLTLTWTGPTTFPIESVSIHGFAQNATEVTGGGGQDIEGASLMPDATSGTIVVPANTDGAPTKGFDVGLDFRGQNGEHTSAQLPFQQ